MDKDLKITLIKPTIGTKLHSLYVDEGRMEPLMIGVLAGLLSQYAEISFYDDRMEKIYYDKPCDIAMITVETYTAKRAYEIAAEFKKRNVTVVMGGMHVKLAPDEALEHADSVMIGDAEDIIDKFIVDFKNNKLEKIYNGGIAIPPQRGVFPRRDIFKNKGYLPITLVQFSRGCVHNCNYCAVSRYFNRKHYCRNIRDVLIEIEMQDRKFIFFVDDNFIANKEKAKELLKELIPLKIHWVSQGSIDMLYDDELMELIVKSGGMGFVMGFESINEASLDYMGKKVNKMHGFNKYKWEIERLRYWGLQTWAAFTIGHDTDTIESIKATCDFAIENKFTFAAYNILMPYPNTPLYNQLKEQNRLLYNGKWWLDDNYKFNHAAYIPKNMTPEELTEVGFYCRDTFNNMASLLYRVCDPKTNMSSMFRFITYWLYNPLFRKEVYKKQDMLFGLSKYIERHGSYAKR